MKAVIMQKLFNGEELTSEECIYVGRNLQQGQDVQLIPYNHESKETREACGLSEESLKRANDVYQRIKQAISDEDGQDRLRISRLAEKLESAAMVDPAVMRVITMNAVISSNRPKIDDIQGLLGKLFGHGFPPPPTE